MKKVLALMLELVLVLSLAACGGSGDKKEDTADNKLSNDKIIGSSWEFYKDLSNNSEYYINTMEFYKGGTAKGFSEEDKVSKKSWYDLTWEIKDDCLCISLQNVHGGPTITAFELDGDYLKSTDGQVCFVKVNN